MTFTTLIPTTALAANLDDPAWVIVDCRFDLADAAAGEALYRASHVPGAVYAHLERDLAGPTTGGNGRHPLPDLDGLATRFGAWGVGPGTQIVAYDQSHGAFASRLWWLGRALGHAAIAVLDGGYEAWRGEGRAVSSQARPRHSRTFFRGPAIGQWVSADEVQVLLDDPTVCLLDARAEERYRGDLEPLDPVAGHIPRARNHPYSRNLGPDGRFREARALRDDLEAAMRGAAPTQVVVYCGSGVTACHNLLALEHAGLPGARLYPGSWSEWCSDPSRPVARD